MSSERSGSTSEGPSHPSSTSGPLGHDLAEPSTSTSSSRGSDQRLSSPRHNILSSLPSSSSADSEIVGVLYHTLVNSPVIQQLIEITTLDGSQCLVALRTNSILVNDRETPLPSTLRKAQPLRLSSGEDILLLSLSSGYLLFVRIIIDQCPLVLNSYKLNVGAHAGIEAPGHSIQTESRGRIFAATAFQSQFCLFSMDSSSSIAERRVVSLEGGIIIDSCFLLPIKGAEVEHVMYLVLWATPEARIKITVYEWWTETPLRTLTKYGVLPFPDSYADDIPVFLVPVCDGVVMITSTRVMFLRLSDIISGTLDFLDIPLKSFPVAYYTHKSAQLDPNVIYISTQSRQIYKLTIGTSLSLEILLSLDQDLGSCLIVQPCNELGNPLDLDADSTSSSYLLVTFAGDNSTGQTVLSTKADRSDPLDSSSPSYYPLEIIRQYDNWAPILDFAAVQTYKSYPSTPLTLMKGQELFVCSGQSDSGAVTLLRSGVNASVYLSGPELDVVSNILYIIPHSTADSSSLTPILFISYPWRTLAYAISYDPGSGSLSLDEQDSSSGLDLNSKTLTAGFVGLGLVQITPSAVIAVLPDKTHIIQLNSVLASLCDEFLLILHETEEWSEGQPPFSISLYEIDFSKENWISKVGIDVSVADPVSFIRLFSL